MEPISTPQNTKYAYRLTIFWRAKAIRDDGWFGELQRATEVYGVRIIKHRLIGNDASQFFVSSKPYVSPSELILSVKGRLQYLSRDQSPRSFQRSYCVRSIGEAKRSVVEAYVSGQLGHDRMADPRVQELLQRFQRTYGNVNLNAPAFSAHGEYWHNLHVVM